MEIIRDLRDIRPEPESVLSIGSFDGVHLAHREIISLLNRTAEQKGWMQTLVTFSPHPQQVVSPADAPLLLTDDAEKAGLLEETGIRRLVVIPFDRSLAALDAEQFLLELLLPKIGFRELIIGLNHGFGRDRSGNRDTLAQMSERHGFGLQVLPPLLQEGVRISSTQIRHRLQAGDLPGAEAMLGRPFFFTGRVVPGAGRGKQIGFPTLNLQLSSEWKLLPPAGVYVVKALIDSKRYLSILNLGTAPTFDRDTAVPELHLFDYPASPQEVDQVRVEFLQWLRPIQKFADAGELAAQLERDRDRALELEQRH